LERSAAARALVAGRLIGVIRCSTSAQAELLIEDFRAGGLRLIELTLTTPGALELIAALGEQADVVVGAGTVMDPGQAQAAVEAGARFLVSPIADAGAIAAGSRLGALVIAGAATPGEIVAAHRAGSPIVKVYPAPHLGGPAYLRTLRGPLPHIPLLPTGGDALRIEDIPAYAAAGAIGVGLGQGALADPSGREATRRRVAAAVETARLAW
jgi:2-dehydro-3-deoxyphosphogluconate aldolase/(4S)-4-hydroxy-2-oxoglutarate aldolase